MSRERSGSLRVLSSVTKVVAVAASLLVGAAACSKSPSEAVPDRSGTPSNGAANGAASGAGAKSGGPLGPMLAEDQLRLMTAPAGDDVAEIIKAERARQAALGRSVLVYVGAKWCEPCQHFHKAAAAGKLDQAFPKLTIVEFDMDVDGDRLRRAGYRSQYIPLFIVPDESGRPTDRRVEGSVKGDGAVDEIVPRLKRILGSS